jgi:hemolysin type calcium-binding protein
MIHERLNAVGGASDDYCKASEGSDSLRGGLGTDQLYGDEGADYCERRIRWQLDPPMRA